MVWVSTFWVEFLPGRIMLVLRTTRSTQTFAFLNSSKSISSVRVVILWLYSMVWLAGVPSYNTSGSTIGTRPFSWVILADWARTLMLRRILSSVGRLRALSP